jgi:hypothetical protein
MAFDDTKCAFLLKDHGQMRREEAEIARRDEGGEGFGAHELVQAGDIVHAEVLWLVHGAVGLLVSPAAGSCRDRRGGELLRQSLHRGERNRSLRP